MRITLIFLFTVSLAGCAGALKPRAPMDALEVTTPFNDRPAMTTYDGALTGRDWNCRGCY